MLKVFYPNIRLLLGYKDGGMNELGTVLNEIVPSPSFTVVT